MHISRQEKLGFQRHLNNKAKLIENKPNYLNHHKDYEDEQSHILPKGSDSSEVRDLKNKLKMVMTKLTTVKKEKEQLGKENKGLQDEVVSLQGNLRQMVAGFSNTSSNFPVHNEIGSKFAEFYKYECLDMFFDILCPEMTMKGIIFFYYKSFEKIDLLVKKYFTPSIQAISEAGCFESIDGPIMNVLRKAFQTTYKTIIQKIQKSQAIDEIVNEIQAEMKIGEGSEEVNEQIRKFLTRVAELRLFCYISDPPFEINVTEIGQKVQFNPLVHDPFDGFIKPKEECWIVLPSVKKSSEQHETVTKSLVLQLNYDLIN